MKHHPYRYVWTGNEPSIRGPKSILRDLRDFGTKGEGILEAILNPTQKNSPAIRKALRVFNFSDGELMTYKKGVEELMQNDEFHVLMITAPRSNRNIPLPLLLSQTPILEVSTKHGLDRACLLIEACGTLLDKMEIAGEVMVLTTMQGGYRYDMSFHSKINALIDKIIGEVSQTAEPKSKDISN